jgi:inorganic pyrophosphatase
VYKALEPGKEVQTSSWVGHLAAYDEIESCRQRLARTAGQPGH